MSLIPPPPVILTQEKQKAVQEAQKAINDLVWKVRAAEDMRRIYENLCIHCLKQKRAYSKDEVLSNLVARYMDNTEFNMLLRSANYEAKKLGYKGYYNAGNPELLKKELAALVAGKEKA